MEENKEVKIEVTLDVDNMLKDKGTPRVGGRRDYDKDDLKYLLNCASRTITIQKCPVHVTVAGHIPHWMLVHLQHLIESSKNVIRYDFTPIGASKFTVYDYSEKAVIA